jgi:hypothetical protein
MTDAQLAKAACERAADILNTSSRIVVSAPFALSDWVGEPIDHGISAMLSGTNPAGEFAQRRVWLSTATGVSAEVTGLRLRQLAMAKLRVARTEIEADLGLLR